MSDFLTGLSDAVGNGLGSLGFGRAALTGFWDAMRPGAGAGFSSPLATSFWGALQPGGSGNALGNAFWGALGSGGTGGGAGPMGLFQSPAQQFGLGFTQGAQQNGFTSNTGDMGSPASAGAAIDQWDSQFAAGIQTIAGIEQVTVPINLVKAVVGEESQGVMAPCNGAGYCGLMQVGLPSAQGGGSDCDTASFDISTVQGNINCGVQELARGYKRCGTWQGALSAYYTGQCDCPDCHDDPSLGGSGETATTYVGHIWDHYQQLQQATGYAGSDPAFSGSGSAGPGITTSTGTTWSSGNSVGDSIATEAQKYIGDPYVWGTHGPTTFDCSGLVSYVVKQATGQDISTGSHYQIDMGAPVAFDGTMNTIGALQPGDLIFLDTAGGSEVENGNTASHVMIYVGNGQVIQAANPDMGVIINSLQASLGWGTYLGARRLFTGSPTAGNPLALSGAGGSGYGASPSGGYNPNMVLWGMLNGQQPGW